jgi:hypothetical protein
MPTILQFSCPPGPSLTAASAAFLALMNNASRFNYLVNTPGYGTDQFDNSIFNVSVSTPNLNWINWDTVYSSLGDNGRDIANILIGTPEQPGWMLSAPIPGIAPPTTISILNVADLVASGYQAAPV